MTNNLNIAEWIIVGILSFTLFVFLVLGIILLVKLIKLTKQAKKVVETSQSIADKVDDVADNIKDMTSIGGISVKNSSIGRNAVVMTMNKKHLLLLVVRDRPIQGGLFCIFILLMLKCR